MYPEPSGVKNSVVVITSTMSLALDYNIAAVLWTCDFNSHLNAPPQSHEVGYDFSSIFIDEID